MKKIVFILSMFAVILTANANDQQYSTAMQEAVDSMEAAEDAGSVIALRNRFEMIHKAYPNEWLPAYYISLCDLEAVYKNPRAQEVPATLEDAKNYLDILMEMDSAEKSEINTLYGYYYMALISTDPAQNGQRYFSKPMEYFEKGMKLNQANPRPVILRAFYISFLPEFIRPNINAQQEAARAGELFLKESPGIEKPFWGRSFYTAVAGQPLARSGE